MYVSPQCPQKIEISSVPPGQSRQWAVKWAGLLTGKKTTLAIPSKVMKWTAAGDGRCIRIGSENISEEVVIGVGGL